MQKEEDVHHHPQSSLRVVDAGEAKGDQIPKAVQDVVGLWWIDSSRIKTNPLGQRGRQTTFGTAIVGKQEQSERSNALINATKLYKR